jgi:hypothetical protein
MLSSVARLLLQGVDDLEERLPSRASDMPVAGESLVPWLAALTSGVALVLVGLLNGAQWSMTEWVALALGLGGLCAATTLVAMRSRAELAEAERDERSRPALEELLAGSADPTAEEWDHPVPGQPAYVVMMLRWSTACLELLRHAAAAANDAGTPEIQDELVAGRDDTEALRNLLLASAESAMSVNETASMHAVCTLWETNLPRLEEMAAEIDPRWYRRWRARTVAERRLRHGARLTGPMALPYSD